jgi:beta-glucosidase
MNILRHPYWGRSQETYGEDMYQVGRMASALTVGIQQHVIACAKHYAANNVEYHRADQNAVMNEQTLREIYLPHFEMVVKKAGVGSIMAFYNLINGKKSTQNKHLLREILKNDWGFRGFVISDWWAMPGGDGHTTDTSLATQQTIEAVEAGMDDEVPWSLHFAQLSKAVSDGDLSPELIDDAVSRILEQKFRFNTAYTDSPWGLNGPPDTALGDGNNGSTDSIIKNQAHLELAEEAEIKSAVLLKNGTGDTPVLPISHSPTSIAVVGIERKMDISTSTNLQPGDDGILKFATEINTGDRGSSRVNVDPAQSIGPYDGILTAAKQHGMTDSQVTSGNSKAAASNADLIVVVVGLTAGDEGEEYSVKSLGDRSTLDLPGDQNVFVNSILDLQKPTIIFIESGSIVNLPWLSHSNKQQATVWSGYSGIHGGIAYGKLMFGDANFSGKLAVSWPKQADMDKVLPFLDDNPSDGVTMGYYFGYRVYDKHPEVTLEFPFGYGLSYTKFKYSNLQIPCGTAKKGDVVYVTADVANDGTVAGDETLMLFVAGPPKPSNISGDRPVKELKRFHRVNGIQPSGQSKSRFRVTLPVAISDLRHWEGAENGKWVVDSGEYTIYVGPNADVTNSNMLQGKLTVQGD